MQSNPPDRNAESGGPAGTGEYSVVQGECLSSIALETGFFYETLWNHAGNSALKQKRKSPHVLLEGDKVHVPEVRLKEENGATEKRHRFRRRGVPSRLKLQVKDHLGKPRAGAAFLLDVDGNKQSGKLDGNGFLDVAISPNARRANLNVENGQEEFDLTLGGTDPISELTGVQHRLNNLGYACGFPDGEMNEQTVMALIKFQQENGLEDTGEPDAPTRDKLEELHKS